MEERPEVDIDKLAMLARIRLSEEEKTAFSGQLSEILGFFQKLQAVDVSGIEPMAHPFEAGAPMREDVPGKSWDPERSLKNAPAQRDHQIVVPKVVEDA
jgi:aspartyl-tRNA(Asn)/glutamyl-tRNA(Gln) amidotransferase subunit C